MALCTYCGKSLANNDDAANHAGECPVMNDDGSGWKTYEKHINERLDFIERLTHLTDEQLDIISDAVLEVVPLTDEEVSAIEADYEASLLSELSEMDEENPDWYWDVSFLSREEEDE